MSVIFEINWQKVNSDEFKILKPGEEMIEGGKICLSVTVWENNKKIENLFQNIFRKLFRPKKIANIFEHFLLKIILKIENFENFENFDFSFSI